ncbi:MAG: hypothetical protein FWE07_04565 [Turicibacter sp.]|nr:hypothetical protein [Turicibacter sp.]
MFRKNLNNEIRGMPSLEGFQELSKSEMSQIFGGNREASQSNYKSLVCESNENKIGNQNIYALGNTGKIN